MKKLVLFGFDDRELKDMMENDTFVRRCIDKHVGDVQEWCGDTISIDEDGVNTELKFILMKNADDKTFILFNLTIDGVEVRKGMICIENTGESLDDIMTAIDSDVRNSMDLRCLFESMVCGRYGTVATVLYSV